MLSLVDLAALSPMTILVSAGNGSAGPTLDAIAAELAARRVPLRFMRLHNAPDGSFPNGIPNPPLPENRPATAAAVIATGADIGMAWDGDFDRCFLFDPAGRFIPGEHIVSLFAGVFLARQPGATILLDPRVIWNTPDVAARAGGLALQARTGHAFFTQALHDSAAI